nr:hypothetical protein [Butyrivibrio sp. XB500-5]
MAENSNENCDEKRFANDFAMRLSKLREQKGVSARDMSLSLGQNAGYINGFLNHLISSTSLCFPSMDSYTNTSQLTGLGLQIKPLLASSR